jgi:hypothetical protein
LRIGNPSKTLSRFARSTNPSLLQDMLQWFTVVSSSPGAQSTTSESRRQQLEELASAREVPLFLVTYRPLILGMGFVSVLSLCLGINLFVSGPKFFPGAFFFTLFGLFLLYVVIDWAREPTWDAVFYRDYMRYGRLRRSMSLDYSEISSVELVPKVRALRKRNQIRVYAKGRGEPLVVPVNTRNYLLKTDLYSWLREKVEPPANVGTREM